jgi:hypothetical protein
LKYFNWIVLIVKSDLKDNRSNWCKVLASSIDAHRGCGGGGGRGLIQQPPRANFQKNLLKKCNKS